MIYAKTQQELAVALDRSRRTILDWTKQPGFPPKGKRGWKISSVKEWRAAKDVPGDPLMEGVVSPALERYRMARARLAELDLRTKRRQTLPADSVIQVMSIIASTMRAAFDQLRREFGPEAFAICEQAISDCEEIFQRGLLPRKKDATPTP